MAFAFNGFFLCTILVAKGMIINLTDTGCIYPLATTNDVMLL